MADGCVKPKACADSKPLGVIPVRDAAHIHVGKAGWGEDQVKGGPGIRGKAEESGKVVAGSHGDIAQGNPGQIHDPIYDFVDCAVPSQDHQGVFSFVPCDLSCQPGGVTLVSGHMDLIGHAPLFEHWFQRFPYLLPQAGPGSRVYDECIHRFLLWDFIF